ncbi:hypothetical protein EYR36_011803 [Pleurotus pulmonarius]|nr:hypothetical protein EYR36_011803 [Pleurotus pulmonarius]
MAPRTLKGKAARSKATESGAKPVRGGNAKKRRAQEDAEDAACRRVTRASRRAADTPVVALPEESSPDVPNGPFNRSESPLTESDDEPLVAETSNEMTMEIDNDLTDEDEDGQHAKSDYTRINAAEHMEMSIEDGPPLMITGANAVKDRKVQRKGEDVTVGSDAGSDDDGLRLMSSKEKRAIEQGAAVSKMKEANGAHKTEYLSCRAVADELLEHYSLRAIRRFEDAWKAASLSAYKQRHMPLGPSNQDDSRKELVECVRMADVLIRKACKAQDKGFTTCISHKKNPVGYVNCFKLSDNEALNCGCAITSGLLELWLEKTAAAAGTPVRGDPDVVFNSISWTPERLQIVEAAVFELCGLTPAELFCLKEQRLIRTAEWALSHLNDRFSLRPGAEELEAALDMFRKGAAKINRE